MNAPMSRFLFGKSVEAIAVLSFFMSCAAHAGENALIIVRHGEDFSLTDEQKDQGIKESSLWERCPVDTYTERVGVECEHGWFRYKGVFKDEKAQYVKIPWRRLNSEGRAQAQNIATELPGWLSDRGYSRVNRVVTKDPGSYGGTQNPFQTIYPLVIELDRDSANYLPGRDFVRFKFLKDMSKDELTHGALFDGTEFSTVLCWDREGIWGKKGAPHPQPRTILRELLQEDAEALTWPEDRPVKGETVYILVYDENEEKFVLNEIVKISEM